MIKDGVFTPAFDALVSAALKRRHIPGLSIAVIDDQTVFAKVYVIPLPSTTSTKISQGYGHSRLPDEDVTPDTLFHCASMTKAFTATAVSLLVDDDEKYPDVKWTAPVSSLIRDDFVLSDGRTDEVTVEDLLSHRIGLPKYDYILLQPGTRTTCIDQPQPRRRLLRLRRQSPGHPQISDKKAPPSPPKLPAPHQVAIQQLHVHRVRLPGRKLHRTVAWLLPPRTYLGAAENERHLLRQRGPSIADRYVRSSERLRLG